VEKDVEVPPTKHWSINVHWRNLTKIEKKRSKTCHLRKQI